MKGRQDRRSSLSLTVAGGSAAFIALVQVFFWLSALFQGSSLAPLNAGEIISLFTGAVTAGTLVGIAVQVQQGVESSHRAAGESALRADALQAQFDETEMRQHRSLAYHFIDSNRNQIEVLANWFFNRRREYSSPDVNAEAMKASGVKDREQAVRNAFVSVSSILLFYHRVRLHLRLHRDDLLRLGFSPDYLLSLFFFGSWVEVGLVELVEAIDEEFSNLTDEERSVIGRPYYVESIRLLDRVWSQRQHDLVATG